MTTPTNNPDDKATKSTSPTDNKTKASAGGVKVRLLARSWLCPVEDDKGKLTYLRYGKGDELEVSEEVFENLAGPEAFKPAFERVGDS